MILGRYPHGHILPVKNTRNLCLTAARRSARSNVSSPVIPNSLSSIDSTSAGSTSSFRHNASNGSIRQESNFPEFNIPQNLR